MGEATTHNIMVGIWCPYSSSSCQIVNFSSVQYLESKLTNMLIFLCVSAHNIMAHMWCLKIHWQQKDQTNTLDRRTQTTIFRLHTGHCGLRKHLKRLGLADSAHCECGSEEQTPEHILQTCPHLETVRQQFWPEDTEVGTKLWGQAAELQRTADFLAATGLKI